MMKFDKTKGFGVIYQKNKGLKAKKGQNRTLWNTPIKFHLKSPQFGQFIGILSIVHRSNIRPNLVPIDWVEGFKMTLSNKGSHDFWHFPHVFLV